MSMRAVLLLAAKDMARDLRLAVLVVFLLAFSYVNITFFASFISGLGNTFQEEVINTGTSHLIVGVAEDSSARYLSNVASLEKRIEADSRVRATTAHIAMALTIKYKDKSMSVSTVAVDKDEEGLVTTVPEKIVDGSFLDSDSSIVLGRIIAGERLEESMGRQRFGRLIEGLGVTVGDVVTVVYPNGVSKDYRVSGIVSSEGFAIVSQTAYISRDEAESVMGLHDQATNVLVRLDNKYDAPAVKQFILSQGTAGIDVKTWEEASSFVGAINQTFGVVTFATTLVGVIIVVSTIGIVIFINTARKKRIIGVLKAIGMDTREIMAIFLLQSFIFGVFGVVAGIVLTGGITEYLTLNPIALPIGKLRPVLTQDMIVSTALILLVASLVAGYVPARMAAKQGIIETIKVAD